MVISAYYHKQTVYSIQYSVVTTYLHVFKICMHFRPPIIPTLKRCEWNPEIAEVSHLVRAGGMIAVCGVDILLQ